LAPFARCSDARGNDSHNIRFAITVRNDQQASLAIEAKGDPALFIMVVVLKRQCSLVVKYRFGLCKAHAFVLESVGCVLAFVELNVE
jgi:hypothetical protein